MDKIISIKDVDQWVTEKWLELKENLNAHKITNKEYAIRRRAYDLMRIELNLLQLEDGK